MRSIAQSITAEQLAKKANDLMVYLEQDLHYKAARNIGFYYPIANEISTHLAIEAAWKAKKKVYLPSIDEESAILHFRRYTPQSILVEGAFAIKAPMYKAKEQLACVDLDLLLVPAIAIDAKNHRLGYGKGYYDKTLASCIHKKPRLVYIGHKECYCQSIEAKPHDIPADTIMCL